MTDERRDNMRKEYTLGLYEKSMPSWLGWREKLEEAKKTGYDLWR